MFEKEFLEKIKEMYDNGMTQDEIARKVSLSRATIQFYVNGTKKPKNLTVNSLLKVFPNCKISLNGDSINNAAGIIQQGNNNQINQKNFAFDKQDFIKYLSSNILKDNDLNNDEKIKFLQILDKH